MKTDKPYQGIIANNKKGIRELSKNVFKNWLNDSYKSTVHISSMYCFFHRECGQEVTSNKHCKFGYDTVSNIILNKFHVSRTNY
jgi:hypothetical protein